MANPSDIMGPALEESSVIPTVAVGPDTDDGAGIQIDAKLRRAAEREMRRSSNPSAKRVRTEASIGRFDYAAPGLMEEGLTGFLLTSTFDREKSALKEAVALLEGALVSQPNPIQALPPLSSIKLAARGLSALRLMPSSAAAESAGHLPSPNRDLALLAASLAVSIVTGGSSARFLQRLTPIQTTCAADATAVRGAASDLATRSEHWQYCWPGGSAPDREDEAQLLTFAVAFKPRGNQGPCVGEAVKSRDQAAEPLAAVASGQGANALPAGGLDKEASPPSTDASGSAQDAVQTSRPKGDQGAAGATQSLRQELTAAAAAGLQAGIKTWLPHCHVKGREDSTILKGVRRAPLPFGD